MEKTFTIECTMEERWIPEFLAMLQTMEGWGHLGHSGLIGFFADGDGDFRPEFDSFEFDNLNSKNVISIPRKELRYSIYCIVMHHKINRIKIFS